MDDMFEIEMQAALAAQNQAQKSAQTSARQVRMYARQRRIETRRTTAESHLAEIWPQTLETGTSYHFLSGGDVDALSYLAMIMRTHRLDYLMFSTWCMAMPDVMQIEGWLEDGTIGRVDAYCGEIFPNQYTDEADVLADVVRPAGGRLAVFRTHAKLFAGFGPDIEFAIESSANINTNPRTEQSAIHVDGGLARFYKNFYDGVKSFNRDFDDWTPWTAPEHAA